MYNIELQLSEMEIIMFALEVLQDIKLLDKRTQAKINKIEFVFMSAVGSEE